MFGLGFSPQGSWRILYKAPVEKRLADIQWRIIHGAIATNKYRAHFDPGTRGGCPFCFIAETLEHLVVSCPQLAGLTFFLQEWVEGLGEVFSIPLFVHGPEYTLKKKETLVLIHFLFANAIWKSLKNQLA